METNNKSANNVFDEEKSSFDLMEWVFKILRYWYLFVIAVIIALGVAFLQNRKWIPEYVSSGTIIIKDQTGGYGYGSQALMQGFGVDAGYKNVNNQVIILSSYDLMCRVVDSLPFMEVDYITQGRFKTRNIYNQTPIIVEPIRVHPSVYSLLFEININPDGTLNIASTDEELPLSFTTHYGDSIHTEYFDAIIWPSTSMISKGKMYFRFRDRESLVADFSSRLSMNFVTEGSTVLQLSLASETPNRDIDFINKLCDVYLADNLERKNNVADKSLNFITTQLDLLQASLSVSESAITNFRQDNKFVDVSSYAASLMQKVENYDAQVMALKLKETYLNYLTDYLETNMETGSVVAPSSLGLNEQMLMTLVQQLNDLHIQRSQVSEKNVYYSKYTTDINNVKSAIKEVIKSMRASLEIEKNDLQKRFADVETAIQNLPEKELQMVEIERRYRIDDNYYTFFLQKKAETEIQKASNTPDNDILDRARVHSMTNGGAKRKVLMRYLVIGLLIPLILVILMELLQTKIRTPKEVEKLSDYKLIGAVRHAHVQDPILVQKKPRSSYAEMLRQIRERIGFVVQRKTNIMVSITSTQSGDGKTFLATNMAALYAMTGKKTLLIDMDIRKPNIYEKLGVENGLGMTNYLIGECELTDILHHVEGYDFDFILAGTVPPNPGELIRSDKVGELFAILRQQYDYIVVDTSPIGQVPDAYALVEQADLTLFVVRFMATNRFFCKNTLQQLYEQFPDKLQIVFSDVASERGGLHYGKKGYGYGGNYGYGYGYGSSYGYGYGGYGYGYGYGYGSKKKGKDHYYSDDEEI